MSIIVWFSSVIFPFNTFSQEYMHTYIYIYNFLILCRWERNSESGAARTWLRTINGCGDALLCEGSHSEQLESWWRHQMEKKKFTLLPFVIGFHRSPVDSPHRGPVTRRFDVFFDLHPNKRLNKQSRRWWFDTPSRSLWRHCNVLKNFTVRKPWYYKQASM